MLPEATTLLFYSHKFVSYLNCCRSKCFSHSNFESLHW